MKPTQPDGYKNLQISCITVLNDTGQLWQPLNSEHSKWKHKKDKTKYLLQTLMQSYSPNDVVSMELSSDYGTVFISPKCV